MSDQDRGIPTSAELVEAVRLFLEEEVLPAAEGKLRFHARVAINVLAGVERDLVQGPAYHEAHTARLAELGAGELLVTSMDNDGTKGGYDLALTRAIADAVSVPVVASGGVGTLEHLVEGVTQGHASAVLAASIFHFGTYTIAQAHAALRAAGLPARG